MKFTKRTAEWRSVKYTHEMDGENHINIHYHVAKTELGKLLAFFSRTPFVHPQYGKFNSLEAFWWWIGAVSPDDRIRSYSGDKARSFGKDWGKQRSDDFYKQIYIANYYRIEQNRTLLRLFKESTLPFTCYYLFKGIEGPHQIDDRNSAQIVPMFEDLRKLFQSGKALNMDNIPDYIHR
jgi:hypothetical protein